MNKIVYTGPAGRQAPSVAPATLADVLNPTVPLADSNSNLIRVGFYAAVAFLIAR